jgi:hypothetical protein
MYGACSKITKDHDIEVIDALAHCWGFIDVLDRLRELAQVVPRLRGQTSERRRFLDNTKLAEVYRHGTLRRRRPNPRFPPLWVDGRVTERGSFGSRTSFRPERRESDQTLAAPS